jgi:hypothetical protein
MNSPSPVEQKALRQFFWTAYSLGLVACVAWPLLLQVILGRSITPGTQPFEGSLRDIGYTFTLLSLIIALFARHRFRKLLTNVEALPARQRPFVIAREILLQSALMEVTALFGVLLYQQCGPHAERYARSFILLPTFMFLLFVPRLSSWQATLSESKKT